MKKINGLNRQIMIYNVGNQLPEVQEYSAHEELFIIDLDCKDALPFLVEVSN